MYIKCTLPASSRTPTATNSRSYRVPEKDKDVHRQTCPSSTIMGQTSAQSLHRRRHSKGIGKLPVLPPRATWSMCRNILIGMTWFEQPEERNSDCCRMNLIECFIAFQHLPLCDVMSNNKHILIYAHSIILHSV